MTLINFIYFIYRRIQQMDSQTMLNTLSCVIVVKFIHNKKLLPHQDQILHHKNVITQLSIKKSCNVCKSCARKEMNSNRSLKTSSVWYQTWMRYGFLLFSTTAKNVLRTWLQRIKLLKKKLNLSPKHSEPGRTKGHTSERLLHSGTSW